MKIKKIRVTLPRFIYILKNEGLVEAIKNTYKFIKPHIFRFRDHRRWKEIKNKSKNRFIIRTIHGSKMYLDLKDKGISKQLILNGTREELQTELVKRILKPGMKVLDIGANIGYYALIEAQAIGKTGKIYAIEPALENIKMLQKNIELNNLKTKIDLHHLAVSNKVGKAKLYISSKSNLNTLIKPSKNTNKLLLLDKGVADINTVTVDSFIKNNKLDFIRMDVEGFEVEIFKGMKNTLKRNKVMILFEAHPFLYKNPKKTVKKYLVEMNKLGYNVTMIVDRYGFIKPKSLEHSIKIICDYTWAPSVLLEKK